MAPKTDVSLSVSFSSTVTTQFRDFVRVRKNPFDILGVEADLYPIVVINEQAGTLILNCTFNASI